jgi:hypothetical protein
VKKEPSRRRLPTVGVGKSKKHPNRVFRKRRIVLLDFLDGGTQLVILNDGIGKDTGTAHDWLTRHFAGYSFDKIATGPIHPHGTSHVF